MSVSRARRDLRDLVQGLQTLRSRSSSKNLDTHRVKEPHQLGPWTDRRSCGAALGTSSPEAPSPMSRASAHLSSGTWSLVFSATCLCVVGRAPAALG
ncbi:hypothetical protein Celaphus_00000020, partial [Cervus elaphus hippelaphus]